MKERNIFLSKIFNSEFIFKMSAVSSVDEASSLEQQSLGKFHPAFWLQNN